MAHYLLQVAYTPDAWAGLVKKPQDRAEAIRPTVESLGGKIESFYFAFGKYDIIVIVEMPDNVSAAALSVAASAGGALSNIRTTPLMTVQEGMEVMRKASGAGYKPPA